MCALNSLGVYAFTFIWPMIPRKLPDISSGGGNRSQSIQFYTWGKWEFQRGRSWWCQCGPVFYLTPLVHTWCELQLQAVFLAFCCALSLWSTWSALLSYLTWITAGFPWRWTWPPVFKKTTVGLSGQCQSLNTSLNGPGEKIHLGFV